ncbi:MAG: exodeoxyribonuclease VII small subunit [Micrococcales bacterium]|nr:exodeoxyribonuclease VII small subunit [Micrococcales bacterium]NBR61565.1 exodeoxyribonuclease VII small subunit [Actinomycetota bacterium]NBR54905.1 exodeoxyribonuclease VII small subunit [Micrococcales bacterium]NBT46841.1 exodeoxyribonuclease VII small subunit [Actinomycetota bacterium]NBY43994.1 exodeoxyribonuclease VII small subunit [Micrococcales bacterium]
MSENNSDIEKMTYEQARDELTKVLGQLEAGSVTLDQSMALWQRGELLAQKCEQWLAGARAKLDEVLKEKKD